MHLSFPNEATVSSESSGPFLTSSIGWLHLYGPGVLSEKPFRSEGVIVMFFWLIFVLLIGSSLLTMWSASESGPESDLNQRSFLRFAAGNIVFHGVVLAVVAASLRAHGITFDQAFGFRSKGWGRHLGMGVAVGLAVLPVALGLNQLSIWLLDLAGMDPKIQDAVKAVQAANTIPKQVWVGAVAIGLAPIAEEVLFRGILYPAIKQAGYPRAALWGTSLFFALTHANLMTFVPLTFLALTLTWLYERTDNLAAPIAAHATFNAVNFVFLVRGP